ncbi:MAG: trypsin-like peptidase domain-containing protein [Defluviitaleaceae bacterium]|nr:trypsin-like peptidase domain-containing protein [Defluviitaleaceae bacterium]
MDENDRKDFDPYGYAEIESVQSEIETDPLRTQAADDAAGELCDVADGELSSDETGGREEFSKRDKYLDDEAAAPAAFFNETIKQPPEAKIKNPWRRRAAALLVACTLGAGCAGLGIGAAIPLVRHYVLGEPIEQIEIGSAKNSQDDFISTRSVLGFESDGAPRDGTFSDVYKIVEPSVVSVSSVIDSADIFGRQQQQQGEATGIIFAEDAEKIYIATNAHVVLDAVSVNVSVSGKGPVGAMPVGSDAAADLSVISVNKKDLRDAGIDSVAIAVFGDSDKMEVGDFVMTIGNALGEGNAATQGIISAKEKTIILDSGRQLTVTQTDAVINLGNSGGPLVNLNGEVIGINTAKLSSSYYAIEGVSYSISSNVAKPILEGLMDVKARPFLGIRGNTVTEEIADQYGIPMIGVYVGMVIAGSSADRAGLVATDIITSFNGAAIFTFEQLQDEIKRCEVGESVEIKILREGTEPMTLKVRLGENTNF